jgi:hypothetical protein
VDHSNRSKYISCYSHYYWIGLEIGEKIHLTYINQNAILFSHTNNLNYTIAIHIGSICYVGHEFDVYIIPSKYHLFSYVWIHLHIFLMCLLHTTRLQFQIFIWKHIILHYMVFYSKNYIETCAGQYFLNIQAYQDPLSCNSLKARTLDKSFSKISLKNNLFIVLFLNVYDQGPKSWWREKAKLVEK